MTPTCLSKLMRPVTLCYHSVKTKPIFAKSKPPVQVQDTMIIAWTIRHPTHNHNDPIARAELKWKGSMVTSAN